LSGAELLSRLRRLGAIVHLSDADRIKVDAPAGTVTPELRAELVKQREQLVSALRAERDRRTSNGGTPEQLEAMLTTTMAEARRLTADPKLLQAAANLLNDCRDMWREGQHATALLLARDYVRRIPAYITLNSDRRMPRR